MKDILNKPKSPYRIDCIVELLRSVVEERTAIYVSAPITNGPRFIRWFSKQGVKFDPSSREYRDAHYHKVILPNSETIRPKIRKLREKVNKILIEPTWFERSEWNQDDYRYFWGQVIERYVSTVIFFEGWQYSKGCTFEFLTALRYNAEILTEELKTFDRENGLSLIEAAIKEMKECNIPSDSVDYLERVVRELKADTARSGEKITSHQEYGQKKEKLSVTISENNKLHFKDAILDNLATMGNVAQFISYAPQASLTQRFSHIRGFEPNYHFPSIEKAITELLSRALEGTVNVRSFKPEQPKGAPFHYGLNNVDAVLDILRRNATEGYYSIVNETIDVNDGGVSGVALSNIVEFSPGDTPQCVDKPGICALPYKIAMDILERVYNFRPFLNFDPDIRVEFSIHPKKRGVCGEHIIIWEIEKIGNLNLTVDIIWPNNFSKFLGDKTYGLLVADVLGLPVPRTTVISRVVAPFTFGQQTGTQETWMRTCPETRVPGKYITKYGWIDPFKLIEQEEMNNKGSHNYVKIASVLAQEAIPATFSGSLIPTTDGQPYIEGVRGCGDAFMVGNMKPESLPREILEAINTLYNKVIKTLGPVGMEWVYDGYTAWVVQLHKEVKGIISPTGGVIYPGEPKIFHRFDVKQGLESLRDLINKIKDRSDGVILLGDVGISSHFGDILRSAQIPSKMERS